MNIINQELVTDIYGCWPCFHDAEVLSIELFRGISAKRNCNLKAVVNCYTVKTINEGTVDFDTVFDKNYAITLYFYDISQLFIEGFNHQNVIDGIEISDEKDDISVEFISIFGVQCKFICADIEVLSVQSMVEFDG